MSGPHPQIFPEKKKGPKIGLFCAVQVALALGVGLEEHFIRLHRIIE
jgi:hypothetical protein